MRHEYRRIHARRGHHRDDDQPAHFPDGLQMGQSWQRAQREDDRGCWVNDAERMVWLDGSRIFDV